MIEPLSHLNTLPGWEAQSSYKTTIVGSEIPDYDLIIGQRTSTDHAFSVWKYLIHPQAPATIYEVDDNLFAVEPTNVVAYRQYNDEDTQMLMATSMWLADAITVSSQALADELKHFNPNVYVIPNYIPATFFKAPKRNAKTKSLTIGWAGGSSHINDLLLVQPLLKTLNTIPKINLKIIGQDFRQFLGIKASHVGWQTVPKYLRSLYLDVGLCPLLEGRFNACKTPIKAQEYAARGIPIVASKVPPYVDYVEHGVTGLLVEPDEWTDAVLELIGNPSLRYTLASNAYEKERANTLEDRIEQRAEIYEHVITVDRFSKEAKWDAVKDRLTGSLV